MSYFNSRLEAWIDGWYDSLDDCFRNNMDAYKIYDYLEAITQFEIEVLHV